MVIPNGYEIDQNVEFIKSLDNINLDNITHCEIKTQIHDFKMYDFFEHTSVFSRGGPNKYLHLDKEGKWIPPSAENNYAYLVISTINKKKLVYIFTMYHLYKIDNEEHDRVLQQGEKDKEISDLLKKSRKLKQSKPSLETDKDWLKYWLDAQKILVSKYIIPGLVDYLDKCKDKLFRK